jgi:hypothetical protein
LIGIFDVELNMLYAEGDYHKRQGAAMRRLQQAIQVEDMEPERAQDIIRIGGASWSDLITLSEKDLRQMDLDLEAYQEWLLFEFPKQHNDGLANLTNLSQTADKRMKDLLAKHGVRYQDLTDLGANVKSWEKPWAVYDEKATAQARLHGMVQNRWYWTKHYGNLYTMITAARTLEDLMVWRGTWKN